MFVRFRQSLNRLQASLVGVELVLDHLLEVVRLAVPGEHPGVVSLAGIGDEDEFLAAANIDRPRLVVNDP
jgi:hypothetical protein